jgi:hypothetical protein
LLVAGRTFVSARTCGQRFLMLKPSAAGGGPNAAPLSMILVDHGFEELRQRVNEQ